MIALWRPFETEIVPEEAVLESLTPVAVLERWRVVPAV